MNKTIVTSVQTVRDICQEVGEEAPNLSGQRNSLNAPQPSEQQVDKLSVGLSAQGSSISPLEGLPGSKESYDVSLLQFKYQFEAIEERDLNKTCQI